MAAALPAGTAAGMAGAGFHPAGSNLSGMDDIEHVAIRREEAWGFPAGGPLVPLGIATVQRAGAFHVRRRRRPHHSSLAMLTAGRGWFAAGGAAVALRPGMVYVSSLGSPMEVRCDPHEPMTVRLLSVPGEEFPRQLERELGVRDGAWALGNPGECLRLLDLLRDEARGGGAHAGRVAAALVQALVLSVRRGLEAGAPDGGSRATFLRARTALEAAADRPLPLRAVAIRLGITPMHLNRVFRRHAGLPPAAWLRERRLDLAAARLRGGAAVAAVAEGLGWGDPYAFSRAFRRRFGAPPSRWRGGE